MVDGKRRKQCNVFFNDSEVCGDRQRAVMPHFAAEIWDRTGWVNNVRFHFVFSVAYKMRKAVFFLHR